MIYVRRSEKHRYLVYEGGVNTAPIATFDGPEQLLEYLVALDDEIQINGKALRDCFACVNMSGFTYQSIIQLSWGYDFVPFDVYRTVVAILATKDRDADERVIAYMKETRRMLRGSG